MGRLAPASTNIHPASGLLRRGRVSVERHEASTAPMSLAAACASLREGAYPYFPARRHAECGCGRCGR